jgi:hypothetical protein
VREVAVGVVRVLRPVARVREARDPGPAHPRVGAAPQPVAVRGAQVQYPVVVRVDDEPLAHAAAGHVAAELERQRADLPGRPAVGGAQHGAVVGVPAVGVHACRGVDAVRVHRVGGEADDAVVAPVAPADPVQQGDPPLAALLPAVGAADVGAGVDQVGFGAVEHDAGDEPAAGDLDVAPRVALRRGRRGGGRWCRLDIWRHQHRGRERRRHQCVDEGDPHDQPLPCGDRLPGVLGAERPGSAPR